MADVKKKRMMNPILSKELRLGSRSIRLPLSVMFYDIVLAIVAVISIFVASYAGGINGGVDFSGFLYIYPIIGWTQMGIMLLIVPILTAGSISGEREKQTLEIMLTTPKKPLSIVWGKLLAALSNYMIFIISSVPIMAIAFVLGGLNWFALLGYILMMVVIGIYIGSVGVFCSCAFKKTIISIVMTFLITIALLAVSIVLFFVIISIGAVIHEMIYYDSSYTGTVPDLNFGILPLIMIGNPITGFFDYMLRSMDAMSIAELLDESDVFGTIMPIIAQAWIPLNVIVSGAISYFFLRMAARKLNPIKKLKKKKKKAMQAGHPVPGQPIPGQPMPGQNGIEYDTATLRMNPQLYQPQTQNSQNSMPTMAGGAASGQPVQQTTGQPAVAEPVTGQTVMEPSAISEPVGTTEQLKREP